MAILDAGPCSAWDPVNCGPWPDELESVREYALMAATEVLWERTKRRFGLCEITLRPCRRTCAPYAALSWLPTWGGSNGDWGWPYPALLGGRWYNLGCGFCENECSCAVLYQIELPTPVAEIVEIKIDGSVLSSSSYRVDNWRWLVRLDGQNWPLCQDLNKADTEVDTWSVTATYGEAVPMLGMFAVNELGLEVAKTCIGQSCGNPSSVTKQVVRQGVTKIFMGASKGQTGLFFTDRFINTYNPTNSGVATIYNIDSPKMRRLPPPPPPPPDPQVVDLGLVSGSGQVFDATPIIPQIIGLGLVAGSGEVFVALPSTSTELGLVTGSGTVLTLDAPAKTVPLLLVNETDTALPLDSGFSSYLVQPVGWWASDTATNTGTFPPSQYTLPYSSAAWLARMDANVAIIKQWFKDNNDGFTFDAAPSILHTSTRDTATILADPTYQGGGFIHNGMIEADLATPLINLNAVQRLYLLVTPLNGPTLGIGALGQTFGFGPPEGFTISLLPCHPPFSSSLWGDTTTVLYGLAFGAPREDSPVSANNNTLFAQMLGAHELGHALGYDPGTSGQLPHVSIALNLMKSGFDTDRLSNLGPLTAGQKTLLQASPFMTFHP